jgi:hypothetical protein
MVLVVLYSTAWRQWDGAVASQVELIERLAHSQDVLLGIHYWRDMPHRSSQATYGRAPDTPPAALHRWPFRHTITENTYETTRFFRDQAAWSIAYFLESTRHALTNAEALFRETYGVDMPDDQHILRLRPDVLIRSHETFPAFPTDAADMYYISNWDRTCRPHWDPAAPEAGDIVCLTTKKALGHILNQPLEDMMAVCACHHPRAWFAEQYLWAILKHRCVDARSDEGIRISVIRPTGELFHFS